MVQPLLSMHEVLCSIPESKQTTTKKKKHPKVNTKKHVKYRSKNAYNKQLRILKIGLGRWPSS